MPQRPLSARGLQKPLNLVQLDGGLLGPQSARVVIERKAESRKGSKESAISTDPKQPRERSVSKESAIIWETPAKQMKDRAASKQSSVCSDTPTRQLQERIKLQKQQDKENPVETNRAQFDRLEKGFSLHFTSKAKGRTPSKEKPDKTLPLLAKKVLQSCNPDGPDGDGVPLPMLLAPSARQPSRLTSYPAFDRGDEVEVRDKDMAEWKRGVVTSIEPLMVKLHEWDESFQWQSVRPAPQVQTRCTCGFIFVDGGLFCSACGTKRSSGSATVKMPIPKPPRPPGPASSPQSSGEGLKRRRSLTPQRNGIDRAFGGVVPVPPDDDTPKSATSGASGPCTALHCSPEKQSRAYVEQRRLDPFRQWEQITVPLAGENAEVHPVRPPLESRPAQPMQWEQNIVQMAGEDGEMHPVRPPLERRPAQPMQWEQNTVQVVGDSGEVYAARPRIEACPDWRKQWEQGTAPLVGEDGEIYCLRPCGDGIADPRRQWEQNTAPIVGEDGAVYSVRPRVERCQWQDETVPVVGENGEIISVRPPGRSPHWEEKTAPILGPNGEVIAVRPSGDRYEYQIPARKRATQVCEQDTNFNKSCAEGAAGTMSVAAEDTTTAGTSLPSGRSAEGSSKGGSCRDCLGTSMLPIPSDIGSSVSSTCSSKLKTEYLESCDRRSDLGHSGRPGCSEGNFLQHLGTSMLPIPSDVGSAASSVRAPSKSRMSSADSSGQLPCRDAAHGGRHSTAASDAMSFGVLGTSMLPIPSDVGSVASSSHAVGSRMQGGRAEAWAGTDGSANAQAFEVTLPPEGVARNANHAVCMESLSDLGSFKDWASLESSPTSPVRHNGAGRRSQTSSTDSLRTIHEIIRMANMARQDTPTEHTLECLQDALKAESDAGRISLSSLFPEGPEPDELAMRLRQLPELWRNTIFKMLEQAESCQKKVESMGDNARFAQIN